MNDDICETVKVKADNDDGFMIINKTDLTDEHIVVKDKAAPKPKTKSKAE